MTAGPESRWLVVGLGNPGRGYQGTFHNAGREVAERLARKRGLSFRAHDEALLAEHDGGWIILPETFMNLSGRVVAPFARRKGIPAERILALVDDVYIPTGRIRVRPTGSSAGHNGLRSLEGDLGTNAYPRIRIGIGPDPGGDYRTSYVLSRPRPEVVPEYMKGQETALGATEMILEKGVAATMNVFNG